MILSNKEKIMWFILTILVMFALPFAISKYASECSGMALCMMLFFIVNPVYSLILGFCCGKNVRGMWSFPLFSSLLFLIGTWLFFDFGELWFIVYALVYLFIGWIVMGVGRYVWENKNR